MCKLLCARRCLRRAEPKRKRPIVNVRLVTNLQACSIDFYLRCVCLVKEQVSAGTKDVQTGVTESAWSFRSTAKTAKTCSWFTLYGPSSIKPVVALSTLQLSDSSHIVKLTALVHCLNHNDVAGLVHLSRNLQYKQAHCISTLPTSDPGISTISKSILCLATV